jgi:thiol-disulfide isomerase/thioredoxin
MKHLLPLLFALCLPLAAQEEQPRENLIDALMNAPDDEALAAAIDAGKKGGLPGQMFLEARFMLLINQNDDKGLAALAPTLEEQLPKYSPDNTMIFGTREDFESIIHYTKSLAALQKGDTTAFKKHITEAFWLSPAHGSQFAPHINQVRLEEAMNKVTLDLARTFEDQKKGDKKTSLKEVVAEAPAFLLHFWSPWVQPSMLAMPEYAEVANVLAAHKIPAASILLPGTAESRKEAADFVAGDKGRTPGHWLIDERKKSLASILRIAGFPTVVLVNRKGRILFNGDPADAHLWEALKALAPGIKPPTINTVLPQPDSAGPNPPESGDE